LSTLPSVDFDDSREVAALVIGKFSGMFPGERTVTLERVFRDTDDLFAGRVPGYGAADLRYHNLRHSLMATACMAVLLEGRQSTGSDGRLESRDFELAMAGVLLHDTGYIKLRTDTEGTGAKYTFCHILRSCAFAASYLPVIGATDLEIEGVLSAINCTGPNLQVGRLHFRDPVSQVVGCSLATADFVAQLSDPQYPDKLGALYAEFHESDEFAHVPLGRRAFKSENDLIAKTPAFWRNFVKPKLESDFQGAYRFLARPAPSGRNDYIEAIETNIAKIATRVAAMEKVA
jgi:hypothetical protein